MAKKVTLVMDNGYDPKTEKKLTRRETFENATVGENEDWLFIYSDDGQKMVKAQYRKWSVNEILYEDD